MSSDPYKKQTMSRTPEDLLWLSQDHLPARLTTTLTFYHHREEWFGTP